MAGSPACCGISRGFIGMSVNDMAWAGETQAFDVAVSVIMPARNAAETLSKTLDSLATQTWTDWEALIIDDGSTDGTRAIAEARAADDPRLRILAGPQRGAGAARNAGLALAKGEWVLFLDADDTITPDMMARMIAQGEREGQKADAVHCGWIYSDPEGRPFGSARCLEKARSLPDLRAPRRLCHPRLLGATPGAGPGWRLR